MPQYNATDAIFFGFRVVKRDPTLLIALVVVLSVIYVGGALLTAQETAELTVGSQAFATMDPNADPQVVVSEALALFGGYFGSPAVLAYLALCILASLVVQGAVLRSLVRDRRDGWVMGLQIGGDELRIFVVGLVVALLMFALYLGLVVVLSIVAALLSAVSPALGVLVGFVGVFACILALALVGARLSVAAPASVGEKKFIVFGSWRITKGRMWGLLGAYVILFFILVVAYLFVSVVASFAAPEAVGFMQGMTTLTDQEAVAAAIRSPGYGLVMVLSAIFIVLATAAWSGVGAYAYRMLGGPAGYPNAAPPQDLPPALVS